MFGAGRRRAMIWCGNSVGGFGCRAGCCHLLPRVAAGVLVLAAAVRQHGSAEDLTAETFMAAVAAVRAGRVQAPEVTVAWLVGVARYKLADHRPRSAREEPGVATVVCLVDEQVRQAGACPRIISHHLKILVSE